MPSAAAVRNIGNPPGSAFHDLCCQGRVKGRLGSGAQRGRGRDEHVLRQPDRLFRADPAAVSTWYRPFCGEIIAELTEDVNLPCAKRIGATTAEPVITIGADSASIDELLALNEDVLEAVYPNRADAGAERRSRALRPRRHPRRPQDGLCQSPGADPRVPRHQLRV
ncbi:MAG: hypothetical protein V8R75_16060 [Oscillospiraceae bacterium]